MTSNIFTFSNKKILLISPQNWGKMHISKHHYAIELAKRGNAVYFLNPPLNKIGTIFQIEKHPEISNLHIVTYSPFFSSKIRFHFRWLHDLLMKRQINFMLRKFKVRFDIVWCFQTDFYNDLRLFKANLTIYHAVDQVVHEQVTPSYNANLIISVASEILEKFKDIPKPKLLVNHGLAENFVYFSNKRLAKQDFPIHTSDKIKVGYIGNLLTHSLDRIEFKKIIEDNPSIEFYFWGCYESKKSNIGWSGAANVIEFIKFLKKKNNVILLGPKDSGSVAKEIQDMDACIICYNIQNSQIYDGCNSHKILEYLSTGKVVIANKISYYMGYKDVIQMLDENSTNLSELFRTTINNLLYHNQIRFQKKRIQLALDNSYSKQIEKIENELRFLYRQM